MARGQGERGVAEVDSRLCVLDPRRDGAVDGEVGGRNAELLLSSMSARGFF